MFKLVVAATALVAAVGAQNTSLPIVDLGYQLHRASNFNETGRFYNFSNIRYAAPPLGRLRFAPPSAPAENRSTVNIGNVGRICPSASPAWSQQSAQWLTSLVLGVPLNNTQPYTPPVVNASTRLPPLDPRTSEDCLFLDVFVPEKILQSAGHGRGAPVLLWIYGGGYVGGNKFENPAGLLASSGNVTSGEVIYVSINYRLGSLGFTSGPTFQAEGGVSNLALHDQRFALQWVQKYIHLFGGDKSKVTVFGESAGGGSIMHQITAYGGSKGPAPFKQAIPQSPGWLLTSSQLQQEDNYQRLLNLTNTTSLAGLRALPSDVLIRANYLQILQSQYGTYTYGPAVDGDFVPLQPGQLLAQGRFDKNVSVMVGHNTNEGTYFTPPYINSTETIASQLRVNLPYIPESAIRHITQTLYPAIFNGSYPYRTQYQRASLIIAEGIFTCNTNYLSTAYGNKTYSYLFAVPPAFHGFDVAYTYFTRGAVSQLPTSVTNRTVAIALQDFITSFAIKGRPSASGIMEFRPYGPNATVLELNATAVAERRDTNANARCKWWQKALYS